MSAPAPTPVPTRVFDGHNDVLTRLLMAGGTGAALARSRAGESGIAGSGGGRGRRWRRA